ncbi:MAG: response regulator [Elusimicrobia bacterium]|nr:response regulator [Elusimicrobiota bacterium]
MAKLLVVDDEKELVDLIRLLLEKDGHEVISAHSGTEALEVLSRQTPSMILLDVTMPDMDGYTLVSNLQSDDATRDIPVIVLTGREGLRETFELFSNVVGFVLKPFDVKDLRARVQTSLEKAAAR